jgi:hypothetical protein
VRGLILLCLKQIWEAMRSHVASHGPCIDPFERHQDFHLQWMSGTHGYLLPHMGERKKQVFQKTENGMAQAAFSVEYRFVQRERDPAWGVDQRLFHVVTN